MTSSSTCYLCIEKVSMIYIYVIYKIISMWFSRLIEETSSFKQNKQKLIFLECSILWSIQRVCNIILFSNVSLHSIIVSYQDGATKLIHDTTSKSFIRTLQTLKKKFISIRDTDKKLLFSNPISYNKLNVQKRTFQKLV